MKAFNVQHDEDSDGEASREAVKTNFTKETAVAHVSPPVQLVETSRSVESFNMTYDKCFRDFQEKLIAEYDNMRRMYITEY